jgi:hypothetical protein
MAIDVERIHNLVRTYQRALHHPERPAHGAAHASETDRVSVSAEARAQAERSQARGKKA